MAALCTTRGFLQIVVVWGVFNVILISRLGQQGSPVPEWFSRHRKLCSGASSHATAGCTSQQLSTTGGTAGSAIQEIASNTTSTSTKNATSNAGTPLIYKTLSFTVCNGFSNQWLSLLNGVILARELHRAVVLPLLITDGRQDDPSVTNYGAGASRVPMARFYDVPHFVVAMNRLGVPVVSMAASTTSVARVPEHLTEAALGRHFEEEHLQFGCPLLKLGAATVLRHEGLVREFGAALRPSTALAAVVDSAVRQLAGGGGAGARSAGGKGAGAGGSAAGAFNFLHLRLEADWLTHCSRWKWGDATDNCFTNTLDIAAHVALKGFSRRLPLYLAFDHRAVQPPLLKHVTDSLAAAGYRPLTQRDLPCFAGLRERELLAAAEFRVALAAQRFLGNSVSTFSALVLLERQQRGLWASYFNMGDVPLEYFMPLYQTPWVFAYSGATPSQDYLAKAAVLSARQARLTPFCLYNGSHDEPMAAWLRGQGVRLIAHAPAWLPRVARAAAQQGAAELARYLLVDVPIIPELEEFNYVLATDFDVLFRRALTLQRLQPLPVAVALAPSGAGASSGGGGAGPCDAGVAVLNLPFLRSRHADFVAFLTANPVQVFAGYGPGVAGAYGQLFARQMGGRCGLSEALNGKPYRHGAFVRDWAAIVHWDGPGPRDYLAWHASGACTAPGLRRCARGYRTACEIMEQHRAYLPTCPAFGVADRLGFIAGDVTDSLLSIFD